MSGVSCAAQQNTFTNPLLSSGPDPWIIHYNQEYYYTNTLGNRIQLWKTKTIQHLHDADKATIWRPPASGPNSAHIWAPEIHRLNDKWYIYYTATDVNDSGDGNRYVFALENEAADPMTGTWRDKGKINTDFSGLDGSVFEYKGIPYFVYSAYIGDQSVLIIAKMKNPWTLTGPQVELAYPKYKWEKYGGRQILEGPQFLEGPKDKIFIVYSASACWADEYALGMLVADKDSDLMDPQSWKRNETPVFQQAPEHNVYATGHNSFFKSPDGKEDWILYHANTGPGKGCGSDRSPRAQQFYWDANGIPDFGKPLEAGIPLEIPSDNSKQP